VQVRQIGEDVLVIADPRQPADEPQTLGSR
jgi:hypothetical protein